jgi:hypothetical protein
VARMSRQARLGVGATYVCLSRPAYGSRDFLKNNSREKHIRIQMSYRSFASCL